MLRQWTTWAVIAALALMGSGAMQVAHHATAHDPHDHGPLVQVHHTCEDGHHHHAEVADSPRPCVPQHDHEDCLACDLIAQFAGVWTSPAWASWASLSFAGSLLGGEQQVMPAIAWTASGPRAPPFLCA